MILTPDLLHRALPHARTEHVDLHAESLADAMAERAIDTPVRMAAFLVQVGHESADLARTEENLDYSAERLMQVWPGRFPSIDRARLYAHKPEALANAVYAGRNGNGAAMTGDGWRFRGRGLIQITGRANYAAYEPWALETPEWLAHPPDAARSACWYWSSRGLNALADAEDFPAIVRRVSGGRIGYEDRRARWAVARAALGLEVA